MDSMLTFPILALSLRRCIPLCHPPLFSVVLSPRVIAPFFFARSITLLKLKKTRTAFFDNQGCPFFHSSPATQVRAIKCWQSSAGYQVLAIESWQLRPGNDVLEIKSWQSSPSNRVLAIKSWRSSHGNHIPAIKSWRSSRGCQVVAV